MRPAAIFTRICLCATVVLIGHARSAGAGEALGEAVSLRAAESAGAGLAADESWPRTPRIHDVSNWLSMAEAQSTLPVGFFAGAELYFARARVGEAGTFGVGTQLDDDSASIDLANFTFAYKSSPKAYLGWRSANTGDAFQFSYWHFDDAVGRSFTITEPGTGFISLTNLDEPQAYLDIGDNIAARKTLNFNVYDIDYLKSLAFSRGRWLVTGSIGARIADVDQTTQTWVALANGDLSQTSGKSLSFVGAGPRLTLEGRRSFSPFFSLYARGGYSLLLGSLHTNVFGQNFEDANTVIVTDNRDRTVNVTEIEVGATWAPFDSLVLTVGWLFQSWSDLESSVGETVVVESSQNISFDGLVARAVFCY